MNSRLNRRGCRPAARSPSRRRLLHLVPSLLGLHTGPASPGRQPPSLKRAVGTRCHSDPAAGPATLAHLPLQLGSCLQDDGARGSRVHPWPRHPRRPRGPPPAPANWAPAPAASVGHRVALPSGENTAWTCLGLNLCLWDWRRPSRAELLAGPQDLALTEGPRVLPRDPQAPGAAGGSLQSPSSPRPPVLATGPRRGPHGNIYALPGHLWMDRSGGVLN